MNRMAAECNDKNCPKHGNISTRGMKKTGKIVSTKTKRTAVVEMDIVKHLPKYKRWARDKSRVSVHCPDCMNVEVGDEVLFEETKKISKTKSWVITKIIKKGLGE